MDLLQLLHSQTWKKKNKNKNLVRKKTLKTLAQFFLKGIILSTFITVNLSGILSNNFPH